MNEGGPHKNSGNGGRGYGFVVGGYGDGRGGGYGLGGWGYGAGGGRFGGGGRSVCCFLFFFFKNINSNKFCLFCCELFRIPKTVKIIVYPLCTVYYLGKILNANFVYFL
jgi:hypothetical protein